MGEKDDFEKNIASILNQYSQKTKKELGAANLESNSQIKSILKKLLEDSKPKSLANISSVRSQFQEIYLKRYLDTPELRLQSLYELQYLAERQSTFSMWANMPSTSKELRDAHAFMSQLNISGCADAISRAFDSRKLSMADLGFLKTSDLVKELKGEIEVPRGLPTALKNLNLSSAYKLSDSEDIFFNTDTGKLETIEDSSADATTTEINVICSAKEALEESSEEELFSVPELVSFMNCLDETPGLGFKNDIGKRIYSVVKDFTNIIGFDKSQYFHCRARAKDEIPYVWEQMKGAPYGVTFAGRYNHVGQAFFYFADTADGAAKEIIKHMSEKDKREKVLQIDKIKASGNPRIIDLSDEEKKGLNTFLRYIRFPLSGDTSNRPRAYLIPSYVAECCRDCGFDGIKYRGSKEYLSYVTWSDSFYSRISTEDRNPIDNEE